MGRNYSGSLYYVASHVIDRRVGKIDLKIVKSSRNDSKIDVPEVVLAAHKTSLTIVLENAITEGELMYTEI